KYKEIYRSNVLESIEEIELDYDEEFSELVEFIVYMIYIVVFIFTIFIQLRFSQSQLIEQFMKGFSNRQFGGDISNIESWDLVKNRIEELFKEVYVFDG